MLKRLILLCGLLVLLITLNGQPAAAIDSPETPLIIARNSDLFALYADGSEHQLTHQGDATRQAMRMDRTDVLMSPNGRYLVYRSVPEFYAEAWNNNALGNIGDFLTDLYLLDLETGASTFIAGQEEGVSVNAREKQIYHSLLGGRDASWSPDGTQFAFQEMRALCDETVTVPYCVRIVVYDVTSGESRVVAQDLLSFGYAKPWLWSENGLLAGSTLINPADGSVLAENYFNSGYVPQYALHYQGHDYLIGSVLGFPNRSGDLWYLFDVQTGEYYKTTAYLSVISAAAPDTSLILSDYDNDTRPRAVYDTQGRLIAVPPEGPPYGVDYMVSLDGDRYAYSLTEGRASMMGDASGTETPLPVEGRVVAWGTPVYTLFHPDQPVVLEPTRDPYTVNACGTMSPVALVPGGMGRVLPGSPNRIRSAPSLEAPTIGNIPGGETFTVVEGQQHVCVEGLRWAHVSYNGVTGWTAEGVDGQVFLEPVN